MFQFTGKIFTKKHAKIAVLTCLLSFCGISATQAKVWIVDNNPTPLKGDHVFTELQTAIDAASDGDVIQITPSTKSYGNANVQKSLKIVGAGFDLTGSPVAKRSFVSALSIGNASNVTITGLRMPNADGLIGEGSTNTASITISVSENVTIENCEIATNQLWINQSKNVVIRNCFLPAIKIDIGESVVISNNVLGGFLRAGTTNGQITTGLVFSNNLIFDVSLDSNPMTNTLTGAIVSNNIFFVKPPVAKGTVLDNTFSNNLYYTAGRPSSRGIEGIFPTSDGNTSTGNLIDVDPQFVKGIPTTIRRVDLNTFFVSDQTAFFFSFDFRLRDSSPAKTGGSDGKAKKNAGFRSDFQL